MKVAVRTIRLSFIMCVGMLGLALIWTTGSMVGGTSTSAMCMKQMK